MGKRIWIFYGILLAGFLLLIGRLFELQIIFGSRNRSLAEGNRIKKIVERAPRGIIFDRKGKELVRNLPQYRLCPPQAGPSSPNDCQVISRDEALRIEARGGQEAQALRIEAGRNYFYGPMMVHVLGYVNEINSEEIAAGKAELGDLKGRTGLEEQYDRQLRGKNGGEVFEVSATGEKVRELGKLPSLPGENLYTSVDADLSRVAFEALQGRAGAVVVSETKTGQILVLVSSPSFDPEKITPEVLSEQTKPLFNRAIGGIYPPGSTFKIVTAAAGIEEGKISQNTIYNDTGEIRVGDYVYKNWYFSQYGKTEGQIDLVGAIKRSTDTFFYKVGEWVGPDKLAQWAKTFGLGQKTGIDLPSEAEGLIPDTTKRWFLGNTYHFAIGQADLLATPLQINMMTSVIANDGRLCRPAIVKTDPQCQDNKLKPETLALIKEGMKEACLPGGTAFPFFNFSPWVACKTGTAEFGPSTSSGQARTHAWFTAFVLPGEALAKSGKESIVVTVLVEAGGEGSSVAAPIAKEVLEAWFKK